MVGPATFLSSVNYFTFAWPLPRYQVPPCSICACALPGVESVVTRSEPHFYDAETISVMKSAFEETCAAVPAERLTQAMRALIAERILKIAGSGERDRVRLRIRALMEVSSN
jgi:hypothetical protein